MGLLAIGLWMGKGWTGAIAFWVFHLIYLPILVLGILPLDVGLAFVGISSFFDIIIIYYLCRPRVKHFFGKGPVL